MNGRLFEILYYLLNIKQTTAKDLAGHFEVSVRTIYRDLDKLLVAGIPIYTQQGLGGGVYIDEEFVLDKNLLKPQEQEDILAALQSLSSLQMNEYDELLSRMQNIFQKEAQNWIEVDFSSWHKNIDMSDKFEFLKTSILNKRTIHFDYINARSHKETKEVYPIKIIFKSQAWYLQAYDLKNYVCKIYKLTRIHNMNCSYKKVDFQKISKDVPPLDYQEEVTLIDVILRFEKHLGSFVYDEFDDQSIEETEDSYIVKSQVAYGLWFISFLLSFGSGVEIIKPLELRNEIYNELNKTLKQYHKT